MEIKTVYMTSKGTFWSKVEAEKKVNRRKEVGSRWGDPVEYEPVNESFVLIDGNNVFSLNRVEVK